MYTGSMTKYVVAVSGGVDSVVLLKMLTKRVKSYSNSEFVVAHLTMALGVIQQRTKRLFQTPCKKAGQFDYSKTRRTWSKC